MFDIERQEKIFEYLKEHKTASVEELSRIFYSSPSTIRRTLTAMERMGQIQRTHGGAMYTENANEVSILIRKTKHTVEKQKLAKTVIQHLPDFNTVFIDDSSTCLAVVQQCDFRGKTVFTSSIQVATEISKRNQGHVILMGGDVDLALLTISGGLTVRNIQNYHYDLALLSCAGVDANGVYETSSLPADIKIAAMDNTETCALIFDKSKLNVACVSKTSTLSRYDYVFTDANEEEMSSLLKRYPDTKVIHSL